MPSDSISRDTSHVVLDDGVIVNVATPLAIVVEAVKVGIGITPVFIEPILLDLIRLKEVDPKV